VIDDSHLVGFRVAHANGCFSVFMHRRKSVSECRREREHRLR
jgi:hypothetical protein